MKIKKSIIFAYIFTITPLISGTILFFVWNLNRIYFMRYVDIEVQSFFTILLYCIFGLISFLISIYIYLSNKENRLHSIIIFLLLFITALLILIYSTSYDKYQKNATIKIKNNTGYPICDIRIYGSYFQVGKRECIENKKYSLYDIIPLRIYSWKLVGDSFKHYPFTYEKIKIEISFYTTKRTYILNEIQEGEYVELIIEKNMKLNFRKTHENLHFF